jgi:hypothetical protein
MNREATIGLRPTPGRQLLLGGVILMGMALRLHMLGADSLWGDEIKTARHRQMIYSRVAEGIWLYSMPSGVMLSFPKTRGKQQRCPLRGQGGFGQTGD